MVCIYCGHATKVINSRKQQRTLGIWRRRKCPACQAVFTTEEHVRLDGALVVKQADGTLMPFSRDKLLTSLLASCQHRGRTALSDVSELTDTITKTIIIKRQACHEAAELYAEAYRTLKRFDTFAAAHYEQYHPNHSAL